MNKNAIKIGLVLAALAGAVGMGLSGQYVPEAWAADAPTGVKLAKKKGLYKVPKQHRQQAVAWALVDEVRNKLGKDQAKKIKEAHTPAKLQIYLKDVVKSCEKKGVKCPIAKTMTASFDGESKGVKGKDYGGGIFSAAKNFESYASSSCDDPYPELECGVFECLSSWGEHIGACDSECGGMPGRFCEEGDIDQPAETQTPGGY